MRRKNEKELTNKGANTTQHKDRVNKIKIKPLRELGKESRQEGGARVAPRDEEEQEEES